MAASLESLLLAIQSFGITPRMNQTRHPSLRLLSLRNSKQRKKQGRTDGSDALYRFSTTSARRRSLLGGSRTPVSCLERRVRALRRLVVNGDSMGLDMLFVEAAHYIACLEMKVKVMRVMVEVLEGSDE